MDFTMEQAQAIGLRDKDILVSAGAGAGKTRVLVERIVGLVLDEKHPVAVNQLLVLTFTRAAAAEMKERLVRALEEKRLEEPSNYYLAKQIRLVKSADISTVHSFCSRLLRTYFQELGLDPSFRIGEEGEMELIKAKVMEEVLEEAYRQENPDFLDLVASLAPGKNDHNLQDNVELLYTFSNNFPDPFQWLQEMIGEAEAGTDAEHFYVSKLCRYAHEQIRDLLKRCQSMLQDLELYFVDNVSNVPRFENLFAKDQQLITSMYEAENLKELSRIATDLVFEAAPRGNKEEKAWDGFEAVKAVHAEIKKIFEEKILPLCIPDEESLRRDNCILAKRIASICKLAIAYGEQYFIEKQANNLYDYNDLEHLTLRLLISGYDQDGNAIPSEIALELRQKFSAIFVDEYQDTNMVQESLIDILHDPSENQVFVVGDVKQSIYRFRQARPDLFLKRYEAYKADGEQSVKIELRDNFRSCPDVLQYCNLVFSQCMKRDFGGIDYTEEVALKPGEGGPLYEHSENSELLLLTEDESADLLDVDLDKLQAESAMIAGRMKELREEGYTYKDMAVLLRSVKGYAEVVAETLQEQGIPCICDSQTGYFDSREISLMLNYLSVIDNVYQDIPMASVLLSSIGGFSNAELARIRMDVSEELRKKAHIYDILMEFSALSEQGELVEKVRAFLQNLFYFRKRKKELPLHELLWEIYQKTGYIYEIMLYEGAKERKENLMMLIQKAQEYEKTMFKGLFYFVRYMNQLKSYDLEPGRASKQESKEDAVRIMSIHKSKGLEFPVVFVSRLHGHFNKMDLQKSILMHPGYGIGMDVVDLESRTARDSFQKKVIRTKLVTEVLEEELRVLYVAMTRAQRKLILTACVEEKSLAKKLEKMAEYFDVTQVSSSLDWILGAALRKKECRDHFSEMLHLSFSKIQEDQEADHFKLRLKMVRYADLMDQQEETEEEERISLQEFLVQQEKIVSKEDLERIKHAFAYEYPYRESGQWKRKYSVSELKKLAQKAQEMEEGAQVPSMLHPMTKLSGRELAGAERGTIIHKMMELLPFGQIQNKKQLLDAIHQIRQDYQPARQLSANMLFHYAADFLFSELGEEIRSYDRAGMLKKELPFTIGVPVQSLFQQAKSAEYVLIQGIIDACIFAPDGIWLIDYKTDRVSGEQAERELLDRYRSQMLYYKTALEQITEEKVNRIFIYSFALKKYIEVE